MLQLNTVLSKDVTSQFYAIDLGIMMAILGGFSLVLSREDRKLVPKDMVREFRIESATMFVAVDCFPFRTPRILVARAQ